VEETVDEAVVEEVLLLEVVDPVLPAPLPVVAVVFPPLPLETELETLDEVFPLHSTIE
jgi:hypothetical protein